MIDLSFVRVIGSEPGCLSFPVTARLSAFGAVDGYIRLSTTGADSWPAVDIDNDGRPDQAATLWVFLRINGQWYATGAERLRPSQVNGMKPQGSPATLIGGGWLYDVARWGIMAGYNPDPGESVGIMVVAGSTRSDNQTPVKARTNILEVAWPGAAGADPCQVRWNENDNPPGPMPLPPLPPPVDEMLRERITALEVRVNSLQELLAELAGITKGVNGHVASLAEIVKGLEERLATAEQRIPTTFRGTASVYGVKVPVSGTLA
jgi:hypothetical protein